MACNSQCIPTGARGLTGAQGEYGGFASNWLFSSSTASGTSATEIRLDNAAPASVTGLYINDTNADSTDLSGFLGSFDNSGDFGRIRLFKESDSNVFLMLDVTGVTDSGSEYDITVTYIEHNGTFAAGDSIVVEFVPAGQSVVNSISYVYSNSGNPDHTWTDPENSVTAAQYTMTEDATVQVSYSLTTRITTAGSSADPSYLKLYVGGVLQQTMQVTSQNAGASAFTESYMGASMFWRGAVSNTDLIELKTEKGAGAGEILVSHYYSILINKEN